MHYLNNSATSYPKPVAVADAMREAMVAPPEMSGRGEEAGAKDKVKAARNRISTFLGCRNPDRLIFCSNSTSGLNIAIQGLIAGLGSSEPVHCVTTTNDHNSVLRPLRTLERQGKVEITIVPSDTAGVLDADAIIAALTPRTKLLAVNHMSNVVGTITPVEALGLACRERGITFLVDSSQSAGYLDIDVEAMHIDLLAITGHKYMLGPTGIGALYIADGTEVEPLYQGGTGVKSAYEYQPEELPIRYEAGTVNYVGIVGLDTGRDYLESTGLDVVRKRIAILRDQCEQGLKKIPGVRIFGPGPEVEKGPVISFVLENHGVEEAGEILRYNYQVITRTGLHCAPLCHQRIGSGEAGTIRASFSALTSEDSVEALLKAVSEIART